MTNRELDALVAEKVMGWEYITPFKATMAPATWHKGDNSYLEVVKWKPSTNISDAWQVVEKMRERGFFLTIGVFDDHALAEFTDGNKRPRVQAETAPLAIVKAALEALNDS